MLRYYEKWKEETSKKTKIFFSPFDGEKLTVFEPKTVEEWRDWNADGAWLYNPWTGKQRNIYDIGSDPFGLAMVAPVAKISPARVTNWQPIKTAPRNRWILAIVRNDKYDDYIPAVIFINDDGTIDTSESLSGEASTIETLETWKLSHWMDLPDLPEV